MRRTITVTITETWTWVWNPAPELEPEPEPEPEPGPEQGDKTSARAINLRRRTTSESTVFAAGAALDDATP